MNSRTKLTLGIAAATATGVLVGIVLAPEKAKKVSGKIAKSAGNLAASFVKSMNVGKSELKNDTENLMAEVEDSYIDAKAKTAGKIAETKSYLKSAYDKVVS